MYLRTARLDLDDYNNEVSEGLHITSMAGTWLSIVEGFAGVRVNHNELSLNPILPKNWKSYSFNILRTLFFLTLIMNLIGRFIVTKYAQNYE